MDAPKDNVLAEAIALVFGDRNLAYGPPIEDFRTAASMVSIYLSRKYGHKITLGPEDIPAIMICVKMSRQSFHPKRDNLVDIGGYVATWEWVLKSLEEEKGAQKKTEPKGVSIE